MKNLLPWLLLLAGPFIVSDLTTSRLVLAGFSILIFCREDFKVNPPGKWLLAWLGWSIICCLVSPYPQISIEGFHLRNEGLATIIICFALAIFTKNFQYVIALEVLGMIGLGILFMFEVCGHPLWPHIAEGALSSVIGASAFCCEPLIFPVCFIYCLLVGSRAGMIGLMVGVIVLEMFVRKWKRLAIFLSIISVIIALTPMGTRFLKYQLTTACAGARSGWIVQASERLYERPIVGWGLDVQSRLLKPAAGQAWRHGGAMPDRVHFLPVEIAIQTGFVGLILCCLALGSAIFHCLANKSFENRLCLSVICAWIAFSLFNPSGIPATAFCLLAFFTIKPKDSNETRPKRNL